MDQMKCEFCGKVFKRKSAFEKHACEKKKRYLRINDKASQISLECWKLFRKLHKFPHKKELSTEMAFITSSEYKDFMVFGEHVLEMKPLNYLAWVEKLIRSSVPIRSWCSDHEYKTWTLEYIRSESPSQAIYRTMDKIIEWSNKTDNIWQDFFVNASTTRILMMMERGHISPWFFYIREGASEFISRCTDTELEIVNDFINPKIWKPKMDKFKSEVLELSDIINGEF